MPTMIKVFIYQIGISNKKYTRLESYLGLYVKIVYSISNCF